jgi:hypothetical protein
LYLLLLKAIRAEMGYGKDSGQNGPFFTDHAEFRGMRSSFAGPSVLGHSGQFLLRMIRCSNQIASRNATGDSLKRAITSTLVKKGINQVFLRSASSPDQKCLSGSCGVHNQHRITEAPRGDAPESSSISYSARHNTESLPYPNRDREKRNTRTSAWPDFPEAIDSCAVDRIRPHKRRRHRAPY